MDAKNVRERSGRRADDPFAGRSMTSAPETPLIPLDMPSKKKKPARGRRAPASVKKKGGGKEIAAKKKAPDTAAKDSRPAPKNAGGPRPAPRKDSRQINYGDALRRRSRRKWMLRIFIAAVAAAGLFLSVRVLLKVDTISIAGETPYTEEQILKTIPFDRGDSMLEVNANETAAQLTKTLPYIAQVQVVKKLPDVVELQLTAAQDTYYVTSLSGWAVLSEDFKVLRLTMDEPSDLIAISGAEADNPVPGEAMTLTEEDKQEALEQLVAAVRTTDFPQISGIDLESVYEMKIHCGNVGVLVGTVNELEEKLDWARYLLVDMQVQGERGGTLDVSTRNSEGRLTGNWLPS